MEEDDSHDEDLGVILVELDGVVILDPLWLGDFEGIKQVSEEIPGHNGVDGDHGNNVNDESVGVDIADPGGQILSNDQHHVLLTGGVLRLEDVLEGKVGNYGCEDNEHHTHDEAELLDIIGQGHDADAGGHADPEEDNGAQRPALEWREETVHKFATSLLFEALEHVGVRV